MRRIIPFLLLLLACPTLAQAHGVHEGGGFLSGLGHPVLGLDHLLAMLAVGILSAQIGGRAVWAVPVAFLGVMLLGGLMGMQAIPLFTVESGIAISVVLLGVAIAFDRKLPLVLAMFGVGFFALFHGHAHGTEMPAVAMPLFYALGFVAGTAAIHAAGVGVGVASKRFAYGPQVLRIAGVGIAGLGLQFMIL